MKEARGHSPRRPASSGSALGIVSLIAVMGLAALTPAASNAVSAITVDLDRGEVVTVDDAGRANAPASLAKVMTVFLALEAVERGHWTLDTPLTASVNAARQPATRLGISRGTVLSVRAAIEALLVRSANDVAVMIAEGLDGKESTFVVRMNLTASALGLRRTRYGNASGLPTLVATTTARDQALLTAHLYRRFASHSDLLGATSTVWRKRTITSHNTLARNYPGALGLKTGFTCRAGYNVIVVARQGERTLAHVVLGAPNTAARTAQARKALDAAFALETARGARLADYAPAVVANPKRVQADSCRGITPGRVARRYYQPRRWTLEMEPWAETAGALGHIRRVSRGIKDARPLLIPYLAHRRVHRAGVTNLSRDTAIALCKRLRGKGDFCVVRPPEVMRDLMKRAVARSGG